MFTILSAIIEAERDRIRERVQEVKTEQSARGRYLGGPRPFGWDIATDGTMVPREAEQKTGRTRRELRAKGVILRGIAKQLAGAGHQVSYMTVRQLLATQ